MSHRDRVTHGERWQLARVLVVFVLLVTSSQVQAARCGSDPGDAAAIAATRTLVDSQCSCDAASSHGDYVQCARQVVKAAVNGGLPRGCAAQVLRCARKSTCGRPDAVTCCRTNAGGATSCRIARDADHCIAPRGGSACVGNYNSCCDACDAGACVPLATPTPKTPTPIQSPTALPGPADFCKAQIGLPPLARVPFTTTHGSNDCGGAMLSPGPASPFSGQANNAADQKLAYLGTGCLYTGALPPATVPDGSTSILDVVGISGTALTLAGSAGDGPTDCTLGAGPDRHCSNGNPGTDGSGACESDADCGRKPGSCNLDANCYFGPPVPVPNSIFSACAVSAFLTNMCGAADLATKETKVATILSSRLYLTGDEASPCPRCVGGKCTAGKNVDKACTGVGLQSTSVDCPPDDSQFLGSLTVALTTLTTGTMALTADDAGLFCPDQISPGAFGIDNVRKVIETGSPLGGSGNLQAQTLAGVFCLPATGNAVVDGLGHLPGVGALSAPGVLDLSGVLPLLPPLP